MENKQMNKAEEEFVKAVTDQIETGDTSWVRSFGIGKFGKPHNGSTKNVYKNGNALMLRYWRNANNFMSSAWYTWGAIKKAGCTVKKGARAVFIKTPKAPYDKQTRKTWTDAYEEELRNQMTLEEFTEYERKNKVLLFDAKAVFNREQIDGDIEDLVPSDEVETYTDNQTNDKAEEFIAWWGEHQAKINHDYNGRSYYTPTTDEINIPTISFFTSSNEYYATLCHEITHSTGYKDRLNRALGGYFGSKMYAFEELIAEWGSLFLCDYLGVEPTTTNSGKYIASWLESFTRKERESLVLECMKMGEYAAKYAIAQYENKPFTRKESLEQFTQF